MLLVSLVAASCAAVVAAAQGCPPDLVEDTDEA